MALSAGHEAAGAPQSPGDSDHDTQRHDELARGARMSSESADGTRLPDELARVSCRSDSSDRSNDTTDEAVRVQRSSDAPGRPNDTTDEPVRRSPNGDVWVDDLRPGAVSGQSVDRNLRDSNAVGSRFAQPIDRPAPPPSPGERPLIAPWSSWWERLTPGPLRGARMDPGRRGVAAVAVVAVLTAAVAAIGVWRSRPQPVEVTTAPRVVTPAASVAASPAPTVVVAVAGGVRRPGLFTLPVGSRVADAIRAAGGVRPDSSVGMLNLARRLVDGEQVIVGATAAAPQPGAAGAPQGTPSAPLNLNTATLEQLDALPGVGPVLAQRILDYRTKHGAFRSVDQLRDVGGIGEAKFADLKSLVAV